MPSLINDPNSQVALNYRKSAPSTRFGTPELVHLLITTSNVNLSDYDAVDGNFYNLISIIQKFAEIYAIGDVQYGEGGSSVTAIVKADTLTSSSYVGPAGVNNNAGDLATDLSNYFEESVNVNYTTMYGLQYD